VGSLKQFKMEEKVMTIYDYIEIVEKLQNLRKENPNNFTLGTKVRAYLESIKEGKKYSEDKVRL
tara:strand:+ start:9 stop:200 length:192 start_codon:yes stop_codon:yes gene_type:complete